jgi:hypothetical protein
MNPILFFAAMINVPFRNIGDLYSAISFCNITQEKEISRIKDFFVFELEIVLKAWYNNSIEDSTGIE